MGTPDFAVPALRALHAAGHEIAAVYSQPPRPAGRGQNVRPQPVHAEAERLGLPVRTPLRLKRDEAAWEAFRVLDLDAAVVAAYGLILPRPMLDAPRRGCLNIHASLLPRWRGASPIQAAVLAGDPESGVTIMQMEEGLDTGPMLDRRAVPIQADTTASTLHDALAALGARMILDVLARAPEAVPQPDAGVTYAPRLDRNDGRLDWSEPAIALDQRIRAMTPWPGAFTLLDGTPLKIMRAAPERVPGAAGGRAGEVLASGRDGLLVRCGEGALRIEQLQLPGRAVLDAASFLRGRPLPPGTLLGC
ncbi:methionyl-tRNA formyltransferase [Rhizosaccharibacter radicis]|uniref:Methionyl-tRNA formyltransferase n=1 Tax=Rhizosaccharibacter radicis TaxID=2782605 RepID=A0ABT1VVB7_9PROT|nr:methionyl-tRNA formyltransferase [Acetobacteraceae bacterium KSS12]